MASNIDEQGNQKLCKRCKIRYIPINDPIGLCENCLREEEEEEKRKKRLNQQDTEDDDENSENDEDDEDDEDDDDDDNDNDNNNDQDNNQDQYNNEKKDEDKQNQDNNPKDDKNKSDFDEQDVANRRRNDNSDIDDELSSGKKTRGQDNSKMKDGHESPTKTTEATSETATTTEASSTTVSSTASAEAGAGAEAGASASAGSSAAAGAGGGAAGVLGIIIIILIIIIMSVGLVSFFVSMPGMVVDRIGEAINDIWRKKEIFLNGSRANQIMITKTDMAEAGEYLAQMGYDLNGCGFLTHDDESGNPTSVTNLTKMTAKVQTAVLNTGGGVGTGMGARIAQYVIEKVKLVLDTDAYDATELPLTDFSTESIADRMKDIDESEETPEFVTVYVYDYHEGQSEYEIKKNVKLVIDSSGNIGFVMSKYLGMYLAAENSTYLIRNFNTDLSTKVGKLFGREVKEDEGCGLIYFITDENISPIDYIDNIDEDKCKFINAEASITDKVPELKEIASDTVQFYLGMFPGGSWLADKIVDNTIGEVKIIDLVAVDRSAKTMRVYNAESGWKKATYYDYPLDGWVSRYGIPLQLSLTMHLSTLAPDFAYNFAQIAAINKIDNPETEENEGSGTVTELGLLEIPNNAIKSKLLLDLGEEDGEKFYYLEKIRTNEFHPHMTGSGEPGEGETGSNSRDDAIDKSDITYPDYMRRSALQIKDDVYEEKNVLKWLDDIEVSIKQQREANGGEKIEAGIFVCKSTSLSSDAAINSQNVLDYYYTIEDTNLARICYGLKAFGIIENEEDSSSPASSPMAPDNSEEALNKAKRIIVENYKFRPIQQDIMYCDYSDEDGIRGGSLNWSGDGSLVSDIKDDLTYLGSNRYQRYYYNGSGSTMNAAKGAPITIYETNGDGVDENGSVQDSGYMELSGDYYFVPDVASLYEVYIMHNISNYKEPKESVKGDLMLFWRNRDYYRLVSIEEDEDGNKTTKPAPLGNGNYDDYSYVERSSEDEEDGSDVGYYKNNDGWFWRNSIPNALIDAMNAKIEEGSLTAEDVRTVLDDMFEYNIGEIDEKTGEVTDGFTKRIPILLEVKNHWYQDISFKCDSTGGYCYYWDTSENYRKRTYMHEATDNDKEATQTASDAGIVFLEETSPGSVVQIKDGQRVGKAGEKVKRLLQNKYDKYDGTGLIAEHETVTFSETAIDALAMLEQIEGEDSQDIIRDFKRLMREYNIYFKEKKGTALKKKLFINVVDGISSPDKLLPEGDDTVIRAKLPPTQEDGFDEGTSVRAPIAGTVEYITEDAICIRIKAEGEDYNDYTILISGFKVNEGIGDEVSQGTELGKTKKQDVKLTLRDENGAIVKNEYSLVNDFTVKTDEDDGTTYSIDQIRQAIQTIGEKYGFLGYYSDGTARPWSEEGMAQALYEMQQTYHVDPFFALAVSVIENGAGTAETALVREAHNIFSITGGSYYFDSGDGNTQYRIYDSFSQAVSGRGGFGDLIANSRGLYFQAGNYTISSIAENYCHGNPNWPVIVSEYMQELKNAVE